MCTMHKKMYLRKQKYTLKYIKPRKKIEIRRKISSVIKFEREKNAKKNKKNISFLEWNEINAIFEHV